MVQCWVHFLLTEVLGSSAKGRWGGRGLPSDVIVLVLEEHQRWEFLGPRAVHCAGSTEPWCPGWLSLLPGCAAHRDPRASLCKGAGALANALEQYFQTNVQEHLCFTDLELVFPWVAQMWLSRGQGGLVAVPGDLGQGYINVACAFS